MERLGLFFLLLSGLGIVLGTVVSDWNTRPDATIWKTIASNANLNSELGTGTWTVFLPTDAAIANFKTTWPDVEDPQIPSFSGAFANFHVTNQSLALADFSNGQLIKSFAALFIRVNKYGPITTVGGVPIASSLQSSNGWIHFLNTTAMYRSFKSLSEILAAQTPNFNAEVAAPFNNIFANTAESTSYTIFAPNNVAISAFDASTGGNLNIIKAETSLWEQILSYHFVDSTYWNAGLTFLGPLGTRLAGNSLKVDVAGKVNDADIVKADFTSRTGVIHVINKVLVPDVIPDLHQRLTASTQNDYKTRVASSAPLVAALQNDTAILTVFAPSTISPSSYFGETFVAENQVVVGKYFFKDFADNQLLTTLTGGKIRINKYRVGNADVYCVQGQELSEVAQRYAVNGAFHTIPLSVYPATLTAWQYLFSPAPAPGGSFTSLLTNFGQAINILAGRGIFINVTLSGEGPLTIFAPSNTALNTAGFPTAVSLADAPNAEELIRYHIIPSKAIFKPGFSGSFAAGTNDGRVITLASGAANGINLGESDIPVTNGVIHIIGGIFTLPPKPTTTPQPTTIAITPQPTEPSGASRLVFSVILLGFLLQFLF